jgi:hypothetical protein
MLTQIVTNTSPWVFVLFFVLLALGLSQMRTQIKSLKRILILPLVLFVLSIVGVISSFGATVMPIAAWAAGYILLAALMRKGFAASDSSYDSQTKKLTVAGSVVPLVLIMSLFFLKYFVGASLAMKSGYTFDTAFPAVIGLLYGAFSGAFVGRAWKLVDLYQQSHRG